MLGSTVDPGTGTELELGPPKPEVEEGLLNPSNKLAAS